MCERERSKRREIDVCRGKIYIERERDREGLYVERSERDSF